MTARPKSVGLTGKKLLRSGRGLPVSRDSIILRFRSAPSQTGSLEVRLMDSRELPGAPGVAEVKMKVLM